MIVIKGPLAWGRWCRGHSRRAIHPGVVEPSCRTSCRYHPHSVFSRELAAWRRIISYRKSGSAAMPTETKGWPYAIGGISASIATHTRCGARRIERTQMVETATSLPIDLPPAGRPGQTRIFSSLRELPDQDHFPPIRAALASSSDTHARDRVRHGTRGVRSSGEVI